MRYASAETRGCAAAGGARRCWVAANRYGVLVLMLILAPAVAADGAAPATDTDATSYIELESVLDGRCQILSAGGKLRVLRNRHPEKPIAFRLLRIFAGDRPQGLSTGIAPAGGEMVKLGCTRVDGRPQDWVVKRARFESEDN